uniref:GPI ethanolamine phosphate transferase 2 n=1 Tax=Xiphophorus couchianus TaxID=32473 RepID=A0A3B5LHS5_9TELE
MRVRSSVFACFILIFEVLGVALFLRGFFPVPVKSSFSSKSKLSDLPAEPLAGSPPNYTRLPQPLFRRVVLMVVDALRNDFVIGPAGSHMPYTRYLVEKGSSHSFVAKARPPTVTMPRIKVRSLYATFIHVLNMLLSVAKTSAGSVFPPGVVSTFSTFPTFLTFPTVSSFSYTDYREKNE